MNRGQVAGSDTQNRIGGLSGLCAWLAKMARVYICCRIHDAGDVNRRFFGMAGLAQHGCLLI
jgi:hypothetical protein